MKVVIPDSKYAVTFNAAILDFEVGDTSMSTIDYISDDVDELVKEVLAGDPDFPMIFLPTKDIPESQLNWSKEEMEESGLVGAFYSKDDFERYGEDEYPTAILYVR